MPRTGLRRTLSTSSRLSASVAGRTTADTTVKRHIMCSLWTSSVVLLLSCSPEPDGRAKGPAEADAQPVFEFGIAWPEADGHQPFIAAGNIYYRSKESIPALRMPESRIRTGPDTAKLGEHWYGVLRAQQVFQESSGEFPCGHFAEVYVRCLTSDRTQAEIIVRCSVPIRVEVSEASQVFVGDPADNISLADPRILKPGDHLLIAVRRAPVTSSETSAGIGDEKRLSSPRPSHSAPVSE